jgi:F0F1-type ATP synthase alpha subunit
MVDERTRKTIEHGRRIRAVLGQRQFAPLSLGEQVALLLALGERVLDGVPLGRVEAFRAALGSWLGEHCPEVARLDDKAKALPDELRARLKTSLEAMGRTFASAAAEQSGGSKP